MPLMLWEIYDALRDTPCGEEQARAAARAAARRAMTGDGDMTELFDALVAAGCGDDLARRAQEATVRSLTKRG